LIFLLFHLNAPILKLTDLHQHLLGNWKGSYRLILSWLPEPDFISDSLLEIKAVANSKFLFMRYDWRHEGKKQEGVFLMGNDNAEDTVTASWVDSWGMTGKIMNCYGSIKEEGFISLLGSYEVKGHPNWGWRIEMRFLKKDSLQIVMYNISPEGEEFMAGDANYTKVQ